MSMASILIPVLMFDYVELLVDWSEQSLISFSEYTQYEFESSVESQIMDLGYGSYNSVILLNSI